MKQLIYVSHQNLQIHTKIVLKKWETNIKGGAGSGKKMGTSADEWGIDQIFANMGKLPGNHPSPPRKRPCHVPTTEMLISLQAVPPNKTGFPTISLLFF